MAEKFAAEGCSLAINYVSNADRAKQTADKLAKDYNAKVVLIQGVCDGLRGAPRSAAGLTRAIAQDVGVLADCERTVKESISGLGGLDIIVSNAGWTKLSDFGDLNALSEAEWDKV